MKISQETMDRFYRGLRGNADDLRARGGMVAIHNDYRLNGETFTFWQMTFPLGPPHRNGPRLIALIGEGKTDEEALDKIRAQLAEITDTLHHGFRCPANHYHGTRAPTGPCSCGAEKMAAEGLQVIAGSDAKGAPHG